MKHQGNHYVPADKNKPGCKITFIVVIIVLVLIITLIIIKL